MDERAVGVTGSESRLDNKHHAIRQACECRNLDRLVELADAPGGLINDELRQLAWPILLDCVAVKPSGDSANHAWQHLPAHRDEEQVQRDVDRAFVYYPSNESGTSMETNRQRLYRLIVRVLRTHPMLCYFQGYHDIVQVLMLVLGEDDAFPVVTRLSLCRIRDYMLPSLAPAIKHLRLIPGLLQLADPSLAHHLSQTEPFFALSATLTLYAHDIQEYSDIARLFDFILAHEPVITVYLFASIILRRRSELLDISVDEPEMIHFTLSKLPQPLDLDALIATTLDLFKQHPPERLPDGVWRRISSLSSLKTARRIDKQQSLDEAEQAFKKQAIQLRRDELINKGLVYVVRNKASVASVGAALLVLGLGVWLRKSGHDRALQLGFWRVIDYAWRRRTTT